MNASFKGHYRAMKFPNITISLAATLTMIMTISAQATSISDANVKKICSSVDPDKNPNRYVICSVWSKMVSTAEAPSQIVEIKDPELFAVKCSTGNDKCSRDQAKAECTKRGFRDVQYFTSSHPSGSGPERASRFLSLHCKT
jgi:hypothetical protein